MKVTHQAREAAPAMEAAPSTYAQEQTTDSNDRLQRLISVCKIGSGPLSISRDLMVVDALEEIRSGHYASEIANLRGEIVCFGKDSERAQKAKRVLPAYLLSGRVEGKVAQAMNEGRFYHAGLLQLDFDKLEDPAATRDMIIQDPHVLASWISPSGDGVKGLQVMDLAATEAEHLAAFQSAEAYWQARGLTLDTACKNSNRLCFASHDPDLRWKEDAIPLRVDSPKSPKIVLSETHSPREITAEDARAMLAAIPPRPEYSQWLRIASAVWDAVGESAGTALLNAWSPEERPGEYAGKFSDRLTQVRAGTLVMLAKDHGWTSPSQKSTHTDKGNIPEAATDPGEAPTPFAWNVTHGAETWTKDAVEIANMSDAPIVEGLLREREVASVIGAAKTSKTWFSLALALAVSKGEPFLERETSQRKTLYLDYELKPGTFRKRMSLLSDTQPDQFFYQCLRGTARLPRVDEIADLVEAEGFGLVVVDSLYRTGWLSEENNNDTTSRELTALQVFTNRVGCSVVVVDHTAKGGGSERSAVDASRGASSKGGFYDCLLVLRPTDKGPDPAGKYAILDAVVRDWPEVAELPLVSFAWDRTSCTVELAGTVGPGEADANATKILEVLANAEKPIGKAVIEAATSIPETTLRKAIARLVAKGLVEELPDPRHKQRLVYRTQDSMDEPSQTAPNRAA